MAEIVEANIEDELGSQVAAVSAAGGQVYIVGNDSKSFYGHAVDAVPLAVGLHSGVIDYDPAELVISLRAGCKVNEIVELLARHRQMLGFEPPDFSARASIGGMIASGLAGPRRSFVGAMRDFVLGVKLLDGRGDVQRFGGRVIKNVAGFDVARLLTGSLGTLGVILEVSMRVIPMPETEVTLAFEHPRASAHIQWVNQLGGQPLPISASLWLDGISRIRLSGSQLGVDAARAQLGGDEVGGCWQAVREHSHEFFVEGEPITRISLPSTAAVLNEETRQLIEWGGAQRWLVAAVSAAGGQVYIVGNDSKSFYGHAVDAVPLAVGLHSGVIDYDPAELVISLRAGCKVNEIVELLARHRQMLGFEPPDFSARASIGGMIASGLAGPRRSFVGAMRDFVLGVKLLDGRGDVQRFGGRVIKNVAGFDVARLLTGSLGTLGVILEVSMRVIPMPETEVTLAFEHPRASAHIQWVNQLGGQPLPISASLWLDGISRIRLSGSQLGVDAARAQLGGDEVGGCWQAVREHSHEFFVEGEPITRISLPSTAAVLNEETRQLIEWGGAQRWLVGELDCESLRDQVAVEGGRVCAYRNHGPDTPVFHPLPEAMLKLQRSIKSSFDPAGIFNPGRMYPGF